MAYQDAVGVWSTFPLCPHNASWFVKVVLINPYELGRQPFGLAQPAAWLKRDGFTVACLDLSLDTLDARTLRGAAVVAIYVGMHTATRIAVEAIPRIKKLIPDAHLCVYGLYAPVNRVILRGLGVEAILGGECEPELLEFCRRVHEGRDAAQSGGAEISLRRLEFLTPDRSLLPNLSRYAHLKLIDGTTKTVGFAEGSRGCKHLCRHCPVVPVYHGKFRIISVQTVIADIEQQVSQGARHISFGDPDFFNGPTHALRIVRALHSKFPDITYDATIKVEHILRHSSLLSELKCTGCLFIVSAVESVDDRILQYLQKGHSSADFDRAQALLQAVGISMVPTFVPFTPWTTLEGYTELLRRLIQLELIESVPPVQLSIRLLIPKGSHLFDIPGFRNLVDEFDPQMLGYPWTHPDPRVDALQTAVLAGVAASESEGRSRCEMFAGIWRMAHEARGVDVPALPWAELGDPTPHMSEPWYCCAEPTAMQLQGL